MNLTMQIFFEIQLINTSYDSIGNFFVNTYVPSRTATYLVVNSSGPIMGRRTAAFPEEESDNELSHGWHSKVTFSTSSQKLVISFSTLASAGWGFY
jgi:hypothetical protein